MILSCFFLFLRKLASWLPESSETRDGTDDKKQLTIAEKLENHCTVFGGLLVFSTNLEMFAHMSKSANDLYTPERDTKS